MEKSKGEGSSWKSVEVEVSPIVKKEVAFEETQPSHSLVGSDPTQSRASTIIKCTRGGRVRARAKRPIPSASATETVTVVAVAVATPQPPHKPPLPVAVATPQPPVAVATPQPSQPPHKPQPPVAVTTPQPSQPPVAVATPQPSQPPHKPPPPVAVATPQPPHKPRPPVAVVDDSLIEKLLRLRRPPLVPVEVSKNVEKVLHDSPIVKKLEVEVKTAPKKAEPSLVGMDPTPVPVEVNKNVEKVLHGSPIVKKLEVEVKTAPKKAEPSLLGSYPTPSRTKEKYSSWKSVKVVVSPIVKKAEEEVASQETQPSHFHVGTVGSDPTPVPAEISKTMEKGVPDSPIMKELKAKAAPKEAEASVVEGSDPSPVPVEVNKNVEKVLLHSPIVKKLEVEVKTAPKKADPSLLGSYPTPSRRRTKDKDVSWNSVKFEVLPIVKEEVAPQEPQPTHSHVGSDPTQSRAPTTTSTRGGRVRGRAKARPLHAARQLSKSGLLGSPGGFKGQSDDRTGGRRERGFGTAPKKNDGERGADEKLSNVCGDWRATKKQI